MLRHIHDLSDDYEYFFVWMGQSTARPFGKRTEAYDFVSDLEPKAIGLDINVTLPASYTAEDTIASSTDLESAAEPGVNGTWIGAQLRLGTPAAPLAGYGIVRRNTVNSLDVEWVVTPTATSTAASAYLVFEDGRWARLPHVRVLTPYQPTTDDVDLRNVPYPPSTGDVTTGRRSLKTPLVPNPPTSDFEHHAMLLDLTFNEGIAGYGISDQTANVGAFTITGTSIAWSGSLTILPDVLAGGYVMVEFNTSERAWARIVSNTTTTITVDAWSGDGDPSVPSPHDPNPIVTAWIPHWQNNPHHFDAYEGFLYPNNDMQPHSDRVEFSRGAVIQNVPRGHSDKNYRDLFGGLNVFGQRLSDSLGRRINMVHLAINGSRLSPARSRNPRGFPGTIGWYDHNNADWSMSSDKGLWARIETLLTHCLPNALAAEGNTKPPKVLGFYMSQGEGDSLSEIARLWYHETLGRFKRDFRNLVNDLGYNPYSGEGVDVPFVQPTIMELPYCRRGVYTYYGLNFTFSGDELQIVNDAIKRQAEGDEFSDWYPTDDLPRNLFGGDGPDPGHCNGVGEVIGGVRIANKMAILVDRALSYGSPVLVNTGRDIVRICNQSLAMIGASAITSLSDGSNNASICSRLVNQARDTLLQMRQWSFATRRKALTRVRMPDQPLYAQYRFCYAVPVEATKPFEVMPPDYIREEFDIDQVVDFNYSSEVVSQFPDVIGDNLDVLGDHLLQSALPTVDRSDMLPVPFQIERDKRGGMLLYTDQEQATIRYIDRLADPSEFTSNFTQALVHHLAAMLATAIIRGREGERVAAEQLIKAQSYLQQASTSDAIGRKPDRNPFDHIPDHLRYR